jgi:hypothetical protein
MVDQMTATRHRNSDFLFADCNTFYSLIIESQASKPNVDATVLQRGYLLDRSHFRKRHFNAGCFYAESPDQFGQRVVEC